MNSEIYVIFFINAILLNIIFILSIAFFGYAILFFIGRKTIKDWNLSILEYCFISFTIGLSIYLVWCYLADIFHLFNFYTIYLPIVIIDVVFILLKTKNFKFNKFIKSFKLILKKRQFGLSILIIVILLLLIKIWNALFLRASLLSRDPYSWTSNVLYLLEHSHLNYDWLSNARYPDGFVFYSAGNLLISMNKTMGYFFMKFGGVPTFFLYIIMMYIISRRVFKRKYLTYVCLILVISYNYIIYRNLIFLPSNLVNLLILVSIMIIFTDIPNYFLGFIIPTAYLLHALSAIFLITGIFIFYIVKLARNMKDIKTITKDFLIITSISFLLITPFLINIYLTRNKSIFYLIEGYLEVFSPLSLNSIKFNKFLILLFIPYFNLDFEGFTSFLFHNTIGIFLFLSIGGLIIEPKKQGSKFNDGYIYIKVCFVLLLIIFSLPYLFIFYDDFFIWSSERIIETFSPQLILISCLFLEWIIEIFNKIYQRSKLEYKKLSKIIEVNKNTLSYLNLKRLFLLLLFLFPFSVYLISTDKKFEHYYIYNSSLVENIIYINDNLPPNSNIMVHNLYYDDFAYTKNEPYQLLYNFNLSYYQYTRNYTYNDFFDLCSVNNIEYVVLKKSNFNVTIFLINFNSSLNFMEIYPNTPGDIYRLYKFYNG
ncbi:MAG: hypothetical protein ACFE9I_09980 [Candidatus Hermodarchaeota archaeon]